MNAEILKLIKKQNNKLVSEFTSNELNKEQSYLLEHYLVANKRRYLFELDNAVADNLIDETCFDVELNQLNQSYQSKMRECSSNFDSKTDENSRVASLNMDDFNRFRQSYNSKNNRLSDYRTFSTKMYPFNLFDASCVETDTSQMRPPPPPAPTPKFQSSVNSPSSNTRSSSQNEQPRDLYQQPANNTYNNESAQHNNGVFVKPQLTKPASFGSNYNNALNGALNNGWNASNNANQQPSQSKYSSMSYQEPRPMRSCKRKNDEDDDKSDCDKESIGNSFKTAKEQLLIESAKQNPGNQQQPYQSYRSSSFAKRPMSAPQPLSNLENGDNSNRRGPNPKFSLPISRNNEDGHQQRNGINNGGGGANQANMPNIDMTKMKNIEPKLIEIITSEVMDRTPPITWDDIAGLEFVKKTIKEIVIWPLLRPDIFNGLRGPPKGLLLFGPPGTGKTLIAKCIANESKSTFFNISSSTLTSKWQGESEKLVKVLFEVARACQPAVIFIDEIDSLLSQRSDDDRESSRRLKTEFFVQMDGVGNDGSERILLIGATNRPQELDDAARRRFVKRLYIPLPEQMGRIQIVKNLMRKPANSLTEDDIIRIAELSDGYSGADMTNLCRESALGPIRSLTLNSSENMSISSISVDQVRPISYQDFIDAMQQVRASVSQEDLESYIKWNTTFGSVSIVKK